jgi:putative transcriptional regulator
MESLTGNLLVASSIVDDPVYSRGVCLVVHQDDGRAVGVMLNRPMQPEPAALMEMLGKDGNAKPNRLASTRGQSSLPANPLGTVHFGGPLSGPVVAIHPLSQYAEAETGQGIYVAAQKQNLEDLVREQPCPYRLIVGHLGWESDQLQAEIDAGLWHPMPATVDTVFRNAAEMWPGLIGRATSRSMARWIGVADVIGAGELN